MRETTRGYRPIACLVYVLVILIACLVTRTILLKGIDRVKCDAVSSFPGFVHNHDRAREVTRNGKRARVDDNDEDNDERRDVYGTRRIPDYERTGIVLPERSSDTYECDDYESSPRECLVDEGYVACFNCIESRLSLRVCAHISKDVRLYDAEADRMIVLPANKSERTGYCVRESFARDLREIYRESGPIVEAKRRCSVYNAEWLLVRRKTIDTDTTYNFVCRCKYPHLMTNVAGPQSECSKHVACNGHGRLDELSRTSQADPFVSGVCSCDDGWISTRDPQNRIGPYCREATFAEWPSAFYGEKRNADDIDLYSRKIDGAFASRIAEQRLDHGRAVWLPNPCSAPCQLQQADNDAWFCADNVTVRNWTRGRMQTLISVGIGVRRGRDYLRGNGGALPNACLELTDVKRDTVALQYMSQPWNDGSMFAQEIGFLVPRHWLGQRGFNATWQNDEAYRRWTNTLVLSRNIAYQNYGIVWTYNSRELATHRREVNESLNNLLISLRTDLTFNAELPFSNNLWFEYPYFNYYNYGYNVQKIYGYISSRDSLRNIKPSIKRMFKNIPLTMCPDDHAVKKMSLLQINRTIEENRARSLAGALSPICHLPHPRTNNFYHLRPEFNCNHNNVTGCVLFVSGRISVYAYAITYPRGMNMKRFCSTRNLSTRDPPPNSSSSR